MDGLLFEGRIGLLRVEDVLQFAAQSGWDARLEFECEDRVDGSLIAVDLRVREGRLVAIGPRGTGLRLGDLAVGRHVVSRAELEASLAAASEATPGGAGSPVGRVLVDGGWLDEASLEDLLYERHARVVWGLAAWDRGRFRAIRHETGGSAPEVGERAPGAAGEALEAGGRAIEVEPPIALEALLLDRLQRVEIARAEGPRRS